MQIREFQSTDADVVSELICRDLREVNSKDYPAIVIDNMCDHFSAQTILALSGTQRMFVAVDDQGQPMGTASLDVLLIRNVFVDPKRQGIGIGRALMEHLHSLVIKEQAAGVELWASLSSTQFYEKLGYRPTGKIRDGAFGKTIHMTKSLATDGF